MPKKKQKIKWLDKPEDHDYPAAASFLSLIYHESEVKNYIELLREAESTSFKAKDIFRASRLSLLGVSNSHVNRNLRKIKEGQKLSPLLLVRHEQTGTVLIADGYHRMCSVYRLDEDVMIPCKIVS